MTWRAEHTQKIQLLPTGFVPLLLVYPTHLTEQVRINFINLLIFCLLSCVSSIGSHMCVCEKVRKNKHEMLLCHTSTYLLAKTTRYYELIEQAARCNRMVADYPFC